MYFRLIFSRESSCRYFDRFFSSPGNTVTGILRGVVLNVLLVLAALMIIASMSTSAIDPSEVRRMLIDSGLAGITIMGAVIAILTGFTIIPREVESRTVYPVISKPVQRWQYRAGHVFGGAIFTNAHDRGPCCPSCFSSLFCFKIHLFDIRLVLAVLMIFAMTVVLSALIIFFSTFMSWIGTIIVSMVVWFIGSYSQFLYDLSMTRAKGSPNLPFLIVQKLLPNFQAMDLRYAIVSQDVTVISMRSRSYTHSAMAPYIWSLPWHWRFSSSIIVSYKGGFACMPDSALPTS